MSEAVAAVLRFGFEQMALHRVEATVVTGNTASAALLSRAGFQREGVLRERLLKRGTFRDVWMFGLTRPTGPPPPRLIRRSCEAGNP
jgi:[ribosomal protein S5]-alanine N-acetyltransferase